MQFQNQMSQNNINIPEMYYNKKINNISPNNLNNLQEDQQNIQNPALNNYNYGLPDSNIIMKLE